VRASSRLATCSLLSLAMDLSQRPVCTPSIDALYAWWRGWLSRGCCLSFRIPTLGLRRCSIYGVPVRHNTWTPPQYHYFTRYTSPRRSLFADVSTCAAAAAAALFFTAAVHRAQFGGVLRQKVVRVGDRRKNAERLLMMMVVVVMRKRK